MTRPNHSEHRITISDKGTGALARITLENELWQAEVYCSESDKHPHEIASFSQRRHAVEFVFRILDLHEYLAERNLLPAGIRRPKQRPK